MEKRLFNGKSIKIIMQYRSQSYLQSQKKNLQLGMSIFTAEVFRILTKLLGKYHLKYVCWDETPSTEALLIWMHMWFHDGKFKKLSFI